MGDTQPVNGDVNNHSANRRVELEVMYFTHPSNDVSSSPTGNTVSAGAHENQ